MVKQWENINKQSGDHWGSFLVKINGISGRLLLKYKYGYFEVPADDGKREWAGRDHPHLNP